MRNTPRVLTLAAALTLPLALTPATVHADPAPSQQALVDSITVPAVKKPLQALQDIADANGGTRAAGTSGHAASKDYVVGKLKKAGYNVTIPPFDFAFFRENSTAAMDRTAPTSRVYTPTPPDGSTVGEFATMNLLRLR